MGFKILSRVTSSNNTRPVSFVREWSGFRAFYTSLGHEGSVFENADVKKHVTAGILWAVRREALLP
jgi:type 1 glutamine amidotransferase